MMMLFLHLNHETAEGKKESKRRNKCVQDKQIERSGEGRKIISEVWQKRKRNPVHVQSSMAKKEQLPENN